MRNQGVDPTIQNAQTVISEQSLKVLRNTYMLLALTMIPTIIGAYLGVQMNLLAVAVQSPGMWLIGYFALAFGLIFAIQKTANSSAGALFLLILTFVLGAALGPLLQVALAFSNGAALITYAAGTTALIFFSLAGYVTATGKDFSGIGKFLFAGLITAFIAALLLYVFPVPIAGVQLAFSSVIVLLFSGYILYDVSRVVHGGETNYILAALHLYLNIYNLFVALLRILLILSGRD